MEPVGALPLHQLRGLGGAQLLVGRAQVVAALALGGHRQLVKLAQTLQQRAALGAMVAHLHGKRDTRA